jgi:hypothetical protein
MKGSVDPGPAAAPAGYVRKELSADGNHLVFGSASKFEPDGNSNGDVSIYDRNLSTGVTHVVSKNSDGSGTMTGAGIGELDISNDGGHILIGRLVSTDAAGNRYWHLYMNVGDSAQTIDVTPGTTSGVLYGGMNGDGTRVYFTTRDKLLGADTDASADVYEAEVGGTATLQLVSAGASGTGNTDACNPAASGTAPHWNDVGAAANCDAVALAGGAGVASGDGSIFFLSPERLDGSGVGDAPNLFLARPGSSPHFIATLGPDDPAVTGALAGDQAGGFGDIQVTPNGDDAVFASGLPLTGFPSLGHSEIYRYDAPGDQLACVSCPATNASPTSDTTLSAYGLNLADDGRVFFTSSEQLALRDTNKARDAYEWENGGIELISTGGGSTGAGLLTVSSDGRDAFFFTRQVLSAQDHNGSSMKIYDARSDGGFFTDITPPPCQASDECHGPGTQAPAPTQIGTLQGTVGNLTNPEVHCRKGSVKKHGRCVKKPKRQQKRPRNRRNHG